VAFAAPFARLVAWTVVAVLVVLSSGVLVAGTHSTGRCLGYPIFGAGALAPEGWPHVARLALAGVASLLIIAVVLKGSRYRSDHGAIPHVSATVGAFFLAEAAVTWLILTLGSGVALLVMSVAVTLALWTSLVALAVLAGLTGDTIRSGAPPSPE